MGAYNASLLVRTREQLPLDWAETENNLGVAFRDLAMANEGVQATDYLLEFGGCL